jgi:hypothetical protein
MGTMHKDLYAVRFPHQSSLNTRFIPAIIFAKNVDKMFYTNILCTFSDFPIILKRGAKPPYYAMFSLLTLFRLIPKHLIIGPAAHKLNKLFPNLWIQLKGVSEIVRRNCMFRWCVSFSVIGDTLRMPSLHQSRRTPIQKPKKFYWILYEYFGICNH